MKKNFKRSSELYFKCRLGIKTCSNVPCYDYMRTIFPVFKSLLQPFGHEWSLESSHATIQLSEKIGRIRNVWRKTIKLPVISLPSCRGPLISFSGFCVIGEHNSSFRLDREVVTRNQ